MPGCGFWIRNEDDIAAFRCGDTSNKGIELCETCKAKKVNFIWFDGMFWIIEEYNKKVNGGSYFAVPIYHCKGYAEARHGAANWCAKSKGAYLKDPGKEIALQAITSQIEHYEWTKQILERTPLDDNEEQIETMKEINDKIEYWENFYKIRKERD